MMSLSMSDATAKQLALRALQQRPEDATLEDAMERLYLLEKIERGRADLRAGRVVAHEDVVTLDSWIRLADGAVLHDDPEEAARRAELARRLGAVRAVVTPDTGPLTEDARDGR